ncbi:MAG TPA: rhodanese-like domain-containing protein [Coriobacteriia bacterium]
MDKRVLIWLIAVIAVVALLLAVTTPAATIHKKVDSAELIRLQGSGVMVVDVRTPSEFASSHIPGALNVPLDQLQQVAVTWSTDRAVAVYCATGARSANAAAYLAGQGFTKVYDLASGIASWTGSVEGGSGQGSGSPAAAAGSVKTDGRPVFIDFASST